MNSCVPTSHPLAKPAVALTAAKKKRKGGRINGDGLPQLLTSEEFIKVVEEHEAAAEEKEHEKEARAELRAKHEKELADWEEHEKGRKDRNVALAEDYREVVETWQAEQLEAKAAKQKLKDWDKANLKPKKTDFMEKQQPKPTLCRHASEDEEGRMCGRTWMRTMVAMFELLFIDFPHGPRAADAV